VVGEGLGSVVRDGLGLEVGDGSIDLLAIQLMTKAATAPARF